MEFDPMPSRSEPMHRGEATLDGRRLWLVRHGQSTWNAAGLVQGHAGIPRLTVRGTAQASACAAALADEPITALYSSDLPRAFDTAGPIGRRLHLDVVVDARLRERAFGAAEGTPVALLSPAHSGIVSGRVVDADAAPVGGESVRQLYRRAADFASGLAAEPGHGDVVLVCHGGVIRVLLAWMDGVGPDAMAWGPVGNGLVVARPMPAVRLVA